MLRSRKATFSNRKNCFGSILANRPPHANARHMKSSAADVFDLLYENNRIEGLRALSSHGGVE